MLALKINDVKGFMNRLLIGETFDQFPMAEASVTTFNTFSIDGLINNLFAFQSYAENELRCSSKLYFSFHLNSFSLFLKKKSLTFFLLSAASL